MADLPQIVLKPHKSGTFAGRHPWVLAKSIILPDHPPEDGQVVDLVLPQGQWIARGIYNGRSHIRVRLYTWNREEPIDDAFWQRRLTSALDLRRTIGYDDPQGAARLVFSEADGLSGLIVDRYDRPPRRAIGSLGDGRARGVDRRPPGPTGRPAGHHRAHPIARLPRPKG